MSFFLFILVNATLFIRPGEIVPALNAWPIYNYLIIANLIVAGPAILAHFSQSRLSEQPATACVLGVLAGIFLSHLVQLNLWSARMGAFDFAKVVAYFLILVSTVTTVRRLGWMLASIVCLVMLVNVIAVLHYHKVIEIPSLTVLMQNDYDIETGEKFTTPRMQATGIFSDPNDLSMVIVAAIVICASGLFYAPLGIARIMLVPPIGFLLYALILTQSRGGLLALMAAGGAAVYIRFGMARAVLLGAFGMPVALAVFGGRQGDIGGALTGGTGAARGELWSTGLQLFKASPVFGIGHNMYAEEAGLVAHNSYLHALTELGLVGGTPFLGLFVLLGLSLWQLRAVSHEINDLWIYYLLPFVFALLVAYCISMMSLSRAYAIPTYLIAGIVTVYLSLARPQTSLPPIHLDSRVWMKLSVCSMGFIVFIYVYIKVLLRTG